MIIIGIDPGNARAGWAVIETRLNKQLALAYGCIETKSVNTPEERLLILYNGLNEIITQYKPQSMSVEELYFFSNAKTVIPVAQARGVAILCAAQQSIPVVSYTPLKVKQTVCGSGTADKRQVQKMVQILLHLSTIPKPDDAADALAIALTHAYSYKLREKLLI